MDGDVAYGDIGVISHQVDGLHDLGQLGGVASEVVEDFRLSELESQEGASRFLSCLDLLHLGNAESQSRRVVAAQGRHGVRVVGDGYSTSAGHFLEHECRLAHPGLIGHFAQVVDRLLHAVASAQCHQVALGVTPVALEGDVLGASVDENGGQHCAVARRVSEHGSQFDALRAFQVAVHADAHRHDHASLVGQYACRSHADTAVARLCGYES